MKTYWILLICVLCYGAAAAQTGPAEELLQRQALRMKDSLQLDTSLHRKVVDINRWLQQEKQQARQQYKEVDLLTQAFQRIENKRDSLYKAVLPLQKYEIYKQKKSTLINN